MRPDEAAKVEAVAEQLNITKSQAIRGLVMLGLTFAAVAGFEAIVRAAKEGTPTL